MPELKYILARHDDQTLPLPNARRGFQKVTYTTGRPHRFWLSKMRYLHQIAELDHDPSD